MSTPEATPPTNGTGGDAPSEEPHFKRSLGLFPAISVNMTQMCGIGPFITIPVMVATMGGPQALLGWVVGALLAMADGLVWAELGAAMPGAGGTYVYLREAFQYRTGRLMPFLFIWTAMLSIPLIMSTGAIGIVEYLGYYFPHMSWAVQHLVGVGVVVLVVAALYRRIESIARLTAVLWGVMLVCVGTIIVATLTNFDPALAFDFPSGAFELNGAFFAGLGGGLLIAVYDYLGYFTVAYMGEELREPGRVMPRAIVWSITGIMVIYLALNVGVMGVLPWKEVADSESIASLVMEHTWGKGAAQVITALVVVTAFASVFAGLLGGSRVPFNAARDRLFLPVFGRLHPRLNFPHVALLVMGAITAAGSFFELETVLQMFTAVAVLVQSLAQVAALTVLRRRQPGLRRPYRQWLYPVPSLLAVIGWVYVYYAAGASAIWLSLGWIVFGVLAFLVWARVERTWPFGPKEIREKYLAEQDAEASPSS